MRPDKVNKYLNIRTQQKVLLGQRADGSLKDSKSDFKIQSSSLGKQKEKEEGAKSILRNFIKEKTTNKKEVGSQNEAKSSNHKMIHVNSTFNKHIEDQPPLYLNTEQTHISCDDSNQDVSFRNQQYSYRTHNKIEQETAIRNINPPLSYDIQNWNNKTNTGRKKSDVSKELPNRKELGTSVIQFASKVHRGEATF